ncbi:glutathione-disulfide reductase [Anabaena sp. FACHB-709]|uniref:Glutathione reductase n=3 Tax=Nostocaceae TaxID=1162 RepID=GSHR_NOSS1|nr:MULTISPECIES: glutathione-disulfide reductase [Nostocaceae]P48638.2 RecName: Full=Glutathione reductase; Short=GR; Short=GRase [Nostoc sp. PCC 7120 = FACHB-418]BAY70574.1 glutathione reductase [Trichormus variabilis NIES-23]HBW29065.1 glutathione-disulfide reductase [Nostoc sp. UBA8866]MBD2173283.1 glutathione-disulfide reductase [Anabaena cylindrica FACHB-318]MBD2265034.1 glutathione-disulfide reductase [Anabaena sp. FACHB-709]MBD2274344.1 glutathione-disulfide reductase [Nostoc sp. PCC 7
MTFDYDLFVIGAGSGGLAASKRAASYGAKVAIAENDLVGGTCVIRGCVPKKLMVYGSHFPALFEDAAGYGWQVGKAELNWEHFITSIDKEVRRLSQLHISFLEKAGVELISGRATLVDNHTVEVGERKFTADKILIAVGGRPIKPELPGMEYGITSNEIFHLKTQPKHIAIIGSGYIGTEFAGIMRGLGSQVTQITRGDKILKGFDEDIRTEIQEGMTNHGIRIIPKNVVTAIEQVPEGLKISLSGEDQEPIIADVFLVATGRVPNVDGLGLENAGVDVVDSSIEGPGYSTMNAIAVNEYSQTSQPNIYAVGDVTDRLNLTPVAIGEGRAFADSEFGNNRREFSHETIATAVFSNPQASTVGLTEAEARAKLGDDAVTIYRTRFRPMYHSFTGKQERIMMKLVVDTKTDKVLGAHMVGENAAEIIQGVAIAVKMGATKKDFDATVGIHPSSAEEFVTMR